MEKSAYYLGYFLDSQLKIFVAIDIRNDFYVLTRGGEVHVQQWYLIMIACRETSVGEPFSKVN